MANATRDTSAWKISAPLGELGPGADVNKKVTIATAGSYVDKDIEVDITASVSGTEAKLSASATGGAMIKTVTIGTKDSNKYPITGSADITGVATANTIISGHATKDVTSATGNTTGTASLSSNLDVIGLSASGTVSGTGSATIDNVTVGALNTEAQAYTITGTADISGSISGTATASVTKDGYGKKGVETDSSSVSGTVSGTASLEARLPAIAYLNKLPAGKTEADYTDISASAPALISGSYLYINEGYTTNQKISLAKLVPDEANISVQDGAPFIRKNKTVYDNDGKLITGSMDNATVKSGAASITGVSVGALDTTSGKYPITATINVAAPSVTTAGYISSSEGTRSAYDSQKKSYTGLDAAVLSEVSGSINASATEPAYQSTGDNAGKFTQTLSGSTTANASVTKAGWITSGTEASGTVSASGTKVLNEIVASVSAKPEILKTTVPSGVTNAATDDEATTTAPTTGVYVAVNTTEKAGTTTVTTPGYGTSDNNGITGKATAADTAYVKIREAVTTTTGGSATAKSTNVILGDATTLAPTSGYFIEADSTSGSFDVTSAGWIEEESYSIAASTSHYYALNTAVLTHGPTATETQAKAGVKTTATGLKTTTTATSYYVTTAADTTKDVAGSVTCTANVSEGYVPTAGLSQEATIPTTAGLAGIGKVYVQTKEIAATSTVTQDTTHTDHTCTLLTSAPTSGPYATIGTGASSSDYGKALSKTTNKYLKIFDGAYTIA